jgi:hypothetical protein
MTSAGEATVAVVLVNWNGWQNTRACVEALQATERVRLLIVIVDNGSTDGSQDQLANLGANTHLITSTRNNGWAEGSNIGIRYALSEGFDHIFLLNNDAFVRPDTIERLLSAFDGRRSDCPVLGPLVVNADGDGYQFVGASIDPATGLPQPLNAEAPPSSSSLVPTSFVIGAALLAHRRHFEAVGLIEPRFFLNYDETDWCFRVTAAGFPLLMVPDAVVAHVGSASIGGADSPLQTYFLTRNRLLFAERHLPISKRFRALRPCVWMARWHLKTDGWRLWWLMCVSNAATAVAIRRGLFDYALRRFGDCPPSIRRLQRQVTGQAKLADSTTLAN